jgi:PadR family transcriptional regulator PadR
MTKPTDADLDSWRSQLRKGAAELAVLAALAEQERSGAQLLDALGAPGEIGLSDGSIYPLLNRLEREGRIEGRWSQPKDGGRGQKAYRLTAEGRATLRRMRAAWAAFRDAVDRAIGS